MPKSIGSIWFNHPNISQLKKPLFESISVYYICISFSGTPQINTFYIIVLYVSQYNPLYIYIYPHQILIQDSLVGWLNLEIVVLYSTIDPRLCQKKLPVAGHGGKVGPYSGMAHRHRWRLASKRCMSSAISTEPVLGVFQQRVLVVVKLEKVDDDDGDGDDDVMVMMM
jgi:hypothetical protein